MSCEKDVTIWYDEIELESYIIENYSNDAKQLYLHEIFQDSTHPNFEKSIIDNNEINKILKTIQAVYNLNSPERDSVFLKHKIHASYCFSSNSISLRVKTGLPEIKNLATNIIPTGESSLDEILSSYNFDSVKTAYDYPSFPWLTLYANNNEYNMIPIERKFAKIESVEIADFNKGCIGDGNNISMSRNGDSTVVTFSVGSGDCPAGCIYHKYWEFIVSYGTATFVRTY